MLFLNRFIRNPAIRSQLLSNISSNAGVYLVNLLIAMWMTPYLIGHLGVALFGLIPLANSVTSYLSLLTLSLNGAVGRFLAIDLQKGDQQTANRTFNTSLVGVSTIALGLLPFLALFSYLVPRIFDIPSGETRSAQFLFFFVMLSFLVTQIGASFSVSSWARSRFDLRNRILIFSNVLRLTVLVCFFTWMTPGAWQVGLGILIASLYVFCGDYLLWRKLTPELSVDRRKFDRSRVRQLFGMGGWLVIDQVGSLLLLNIELIVANTILGAEVAGIYGSLLLFSILLQGIVGTVSSVFTPTYVAQYAKGDFGGLHQFSVRVVRLTGLAVGLPAGLLCSLGGSFIGLWLGNPFRQWGGLLALLSFHLAVNLAILPLFGIRTALNKVKTPGIVTLLAGGLNLLLAVWLASRWGVYGLALNGAISLSLRNVLFTTIYSARIQSLPWHTYLRALLPAILGTAVAGGSGYVLSLIMPSPDWIELILITVSTTTIYVILAIALGLDAKEKRWLFQIFKEQPKTA
ncbi:MAG TPA: oligosaccharide flippase family protein [Anaerolineales bacterium]|nr:oligosaccharide flippase family protein [Anaerolineales bacterium]HLO31250.1 oligosaccharide flippase family protein [Anaerolineales bacterium]